MSYSMSGDFIEACDCTVVCPCWVDNDPVGGHCTGLVAWTITSGTIDRDPVSGCKVVAVSTHLGNRRQGSNSTTMLYIDDRDYSGNASHADLLEQLKKAFSGDIDGPLEELASVSGIVVGAEAANIDILHGKGRRRAAEWEVTVSPLLLPSVKVVHATGRPKRLDNQQPLTLRQTALSLEFGVPTEGQGEGAVTAQDGLKLTVNVGALPAGNLDVIQRSGMRGEFKYVHRGSNHRGRWRL